jgi:hypothetical protein
LGLLERPWPVDGSQCIFNPELGLFIQKKVQNSGHVGALSVRNFILMMVILIENSFELRNLCGLWPQTQKILALWYSIDRAFHVDDEDTLGLELQF